MSETVEASGSPPATDEPPPVGEMVLGQPSCVMQSLPDQQEAIATLGYWSDLEVATLKLAVEAVQIPGTDIVDWVKVAALVPSRSAKQCRQKWLNHLRDGISKDPWSLQEEYVLGVMHSKIGNKWQVLAKYLPRRPENTVKNHWSATTRAKGAARMRTLLWIYSDLVVHKGQAHSPDVFHHACLLYSQLKGVPHISTFAVDEDHFLTGPGRGLAGLDSGIAAPMGISSRVPPEIRMRLRAVNAALRSSYLNKPLDDEPDETAQAAEDETACAERPPLPVFPHSGAGSSQCSPMLAAGDGPSGGGYNALHAELASAWLHQHHMISCGVPPGHMQHIILPRAVLTQQHHRSMLPHFSSLSMLHVPGQQQQRWPAPLAGGVASRSNGHEQHCMAEQLREVDRYNACISAVGNSGGGAAVADAKSNRDVKMAGDDASQQQDQQLGDRRPHGIQSDRQHHRSMPPLLDPALLAAGPPPALLAPPPLPLACGSGHRPPPHPTRTSSPGLRPARSGGAAPDVGNMLLTLAEAADSLLSDEDLNKDADGPVDSQPGSKPAPSSRKRKSSSGGNGSCSQASERGAVPAFGFAHLSSVLPELDCCWQEQPQQSVPRAAAANHHCHRVPPEQPGAELNKHALELFAAGAAQGLTGGWQRQQELNHERSSSLLWKQPQRVKQQPLLFDLGSSCLVTRGPPRGQGTKGADNLVAWGPGDLGRPEAVENKRRIDPASAGEHLPPAGVVLEEIANDRIATTAAAVVVCPHHRSSSSGAREDSHGHSLSASELQAAPGHVSALGRGADAEPPLLLPDAVHGAGCLSHELLAAAGNGIEGSVVSALGRLATDPSLTAGDRLQLMSSFMKAVQTVVKVSMD